MPIKGRILLVKDYGIYEFGLNDKNSSKIVEDVQYGDSLFSWAPDGKSVVYQTQSNEIDVIELGTNQRRSMGYGYYPTWSPNGKYIAYWISEDGGYAICDSRTGRVVYTVKGNSPSGELVWSPDSRYVAYTGLSTGLMPRLLAHFGEEYHGNVYVTDLQSNIATQVYSFPGSIFVTCWGKVSVPRE